ncbi:3',5'-cyclic-nucleotide phosphodiesterase [Hymenobacter cavernae]|uniref:3',5'-cyclic-nucleotide phosphodiesterase n=1 Tax=Hymenobacter cavernae TaxID=2044852 RepID=A0ABQ1U646_9BACT|nr:3',5'-cyclic-nucleotide phosphodiesterase [Hymenobacter cavernae]
MPLGVNGGITENNLSAYLLAPVNSTSYISLDAGTLHAGIEQAIAAKTFEAPAEVVLRRYIKAYFISHPHLDHLAGLLLNAPDDTAKTIYGQPACLETIQTHYLNWASWPNFGDAGAPPALNKYHYQRLTPGAETPVVGTSMSVRVFPLSHGKPYESAAFLVRNQAAYVLYLGDTGADAVEKTEKLHYLWQEVAPLLKTHKLKGIFIEVSYPNEQPDSQLFGHLTPRLLLQELANLGQFSGAEALRNLPVIVTHLKPTGDNKARIQQQLQRANNLGLKLIFPEQGQRFLL